MFPLTKNLWVRHPQQVQPANGAGIKLLAASNKVALYGLPEAGYLDAVEPKLRMVRNYDPLQGGLGPKQLKVHTVQLLLPCYDTEGLSIGNTTIEVTIKIPSGGTIIPGNILTSLRSLACVEDTHPIAEFLAGDDLTIESYATQVPDTDPSL